jgi:hypothetical protein
VRHVCLLCRVQGLHHDLLNNIAYCAEFYDTIQWGKKVQAKVQEFQVTRERLWVLNQLNKLEAELLQAQADLATSRDRLAYLREEESRPLSSE